MKKKPTLRKAASRRTTRATTKAATSATAKPARTTSARTVYSATPPPPVTALPRRAIFIDVENTSSETNVLRVIEHLKIDRTTQPTELIAVGNWHSMGTRFARTLAGLGAQLMHSAPAPGVRDWSDLWIAVAAGRWLAHATPGDVLEIVSDDRAFDAVADAAASAGVAFRRASYRTVVPSPPPPAAAPAARAGRRGRGGRGRRAAPAEAQPRETTRPAPAGSPPGGGPAATAVSEEEAHAASQEHIRVALARLSGGGQPINLDTLGNFLRAEGFTRPPGSPRLITRLRKLKDVEVSSSGMIRLLGEAPAPVEAAPAPAAARRRPRRRGGRRRRRPTATSAGGGTEKAKETSGS